MNYMTAFAIRYYEYQYEDGMRLRQESFLDEIEFKSRLNKIKGDANVYEISCYQGGLTKIDNSLL